MLGTGGFMGQAREAEDVVFAWRAASVTNLALYIDIMERSLGESSGAAVEPEASASAPRATWRLCVEAEKDDPPGAAGCVCVSSTGVEARGKSQSRNSPSCL